MARLTIDDIASLRAASEPMQIGIANYASSAPFKSDHCNTKPQSKSMAHRFSIEAHNFYGSALKKTAKEKFPRRLIPLGIGRPTDELYPWSSFTFEENFMRHKKAENGGNQIYASSGARKIIKREGVFDLATALNYSHSVGQQPLLRFMTEHVEVIHNPPYSDWSVGLTCGSTSAFEIALRLFCNRGDTVLTEEYTYPGLLSTALLLGLSTLGVGMDADGMIPEDLAAILRNWDEFDGQRPTVLYTIPSGQNPTGATQSVKRKTDIYRIAEEFDLIIIEDDPYYFLQTEYSTDQIVGALHDGQADSSAVAAYLHNLSSTFLSLDIAGRVIRLDSASKILAPGLRAGWVTSSSEIIEKFISYQEVGPVAMAGPTQLVLWNLLDASWGHHGFIAWLASLSTYYRTRLDIMLKACNRYLPKGVCRWSRPRNGMFLWIHLAANEHPVLRSSHWAGLKESTSRSAIDDVESRIWSKACEEGVQVTKGSLFRATAMTNASLSFRLTYATADENDLEEGVKCFAKAVRQEFQLSQLA